MSSTILTNWTIYYADDAAAGAGMKQIKWTGTTGTNTIKELYSALMDLFDNASQNDAVDSIPIKAITPTLYEIGISDAGDRQPWFIDSDSITHLTGGGLNTAGWLRDTSARTGSQGIYKLTRSSTNITTADIGRTVTVSGTVRGWLLHVSGNYLWIRPTSYESSYDFAPGISVNATGTARTDTITAATSDESIWSNLYTLGTLETNTQLYIYQSGTAIAPWWSTDHIDVLVLTTDFGSLIDSGSLTVYARQYAKLYDHFISDTSAGGRIPIPLATSPDTNNTTVEGTVSGYNITFSSFGTFPHDVDGDGIDENYDVEINCHTLTLKQMYEYLKYVTRGGSTTSLNGVYGEAYQAAQAGYAPVKAAPFGTFAGGKFFGARGVYIYGYASSDANNYQLIDAANNLRTPPQSIALTVNGLVSGDQVGVFQATGDNNTIDRSMFTIDPTTPAGAGVTQVRVNEIIPNDTPATGNIRLVHRTAAGNIEDEEKLAYSAWSNSTQGSGYSTFTVTSFTSTLDSTDTAYVPYIDASSSDGSPVSVSLIYTAGRYLTARVRQTGYLPFMSKYQLTNANLTITAVRADDPVLT